MTRLARVPELQSLTPRRRRPAAVSRIFLLAPLILPAVLAVSALGAGRLRVCLVAGSETPVNQAGLMMLRLKVALERDYPVDGILVTSRDGENHFENLEALRTADAAVFLIRRKTPPPAQLAIFREFFDSGRGFVTVKSTSHAFENWKTFDAEILGATYAGGFADHARLQVINAYPHPIFTGAEGFETDQGMYAYTELARDILILMEGTVGEATVPMAWVRPHRGGRIFHFSPGGAALAKDPEYLRIIGNALLWVSRRPIPGARTAVQRSYLPDAYPGAFAITFPRGPGLCYDPVRGGINYAWEGDFADLRPRWLTKQGQPVRFVGNVFYREQNRLPLRTEPTREPVGEFLGYVLVDGFPEFHWMVDGREVRELLRPLADGVGVVRRFSVGAGVGPLWLLLEPQVGAEVTIDGAVRDDNAVRYTGGAGEFSVMVRRKAPVLP